MARRGDPRVLRHVVNFLRHETGMSQEQFGKACGMNQGQISRYELGHMAPSEKGMRRMAEVAGFKWPLVVQLRQFYSSILAASARGLPALATGTPAPASPEPLPLEAVPFLIDAESRPSPKELREEAEQIWTALASFSSQRRRHLISLTLQASGSWALAELVSHESERMAAHKVEDALELSDLALSIAERVPGESDWRYRVQGYCWAYIANARRVANDHAGADEAFARARDLWRAGSAHSDPELLAEWRLLDLEASLRRDQRRFSESLGLLDKAQAASGREPLAAGRILLKKEHVFDEMGDPHRALAALTEAAPFIDASTDARLKFLYRFKIANNLSQLGNYDQAEKVLEGVRQMAIQLGNALDLLRLVWLESKVAEGQGRAEQAIAGLEQVHLDFTSRNLPYDAALSSLDLSVLWLEAGRTSEVRQLAIAMNWIFSAKGIAREALAALGVFCEAARQESATVELARQAIADIEQARRSAPPPRQ